MESLDVIKDINFPLAVYLSNCMWRIMDNFLFCVSNFIELFQYPSFNNKQREPEDGCFIFVDTVHHKVKSELM